MNPTPENLAQFMAVMAFLAGVGVNFLTVGKLLRNDPEKREVRMATDYATREEVGLLRQELNQLRVQSRQEKDEILRAGEERARKLHERIDQLVEEMPGRMIAMLKDAGALRTRKGKEAA